MNYNILYTIIIYPITQIIEFTFIFAQKLFKNTGISIICMSGIISILCLPLYIVAEHWQKIERNIQKNLAPKIAKIKAVFKGDERYMILSTYYRQNKYHPIYALRSSFGILIQIPFFIAAYSYISNFEAIKNTSFLFINNLGAPDALFAINGFTINLLPIAMTIINCLSGAIYSKGLLLKDKLQIYGMALIFLILLYNSPSALILYWTMNNIFSFVKNIYYRLPIKNKQLILSGFFSTCCILLAIFCISIYTNNKKAQALAIVCLLASAVPWLFYLFKEKFSGIISTNYSSAKIFAIFLLALFLAWTILGLFLPSQLIASSPQEFSFIDENTTPIIFIINTAIQFFGLLIFWPICLYFLFSEKIKKYFSVIFLGLSIGILVNIFFFPGDYGFVSVSIIFSKHIVHHIPEILLNFSIMLFILIASFALLKFKNKNIIIIFLSICQFSLLSLSVINITKINSAFNKLESFYTKQQTKKQEVSPLLSLSRNGTNIVILMIDRASSIFIPYIFDESPELKEIYSGFNYYPNTVSFSGYTVMGSPPVYGGYEYTPEEMNKRNNIPLVEKHNEALIMLPRILSENGFSVFVTDPPYTNYNWKCDLSIFNNYPGIKTFITDAQYTDTWIEDNNMHLPKTNTVIKRNLFWYSLVKSIPLLFRQPIYMEGNWCSPVSNYSIRLTIEAYSVLDYLPRLIRINDDTENKAVIMTNNTTHEVSFLQAPEYRPVTTVTNYGKSRFANKAAYHVNAAAIKRLGEWFNVLKDENVYNNTKIILVSDHAAAESFTIKNGLPFYIEQYNPLLMVKDFNAFGEMKTDMSFMSNADVPYLALNNIIDNPTNPFTGNSISNERKKNPLYIAISGGKNLPANTVTQFPLNKKIDRYIHDDIFVAENWTSITD